MKISQGKSEAAATYEKKFTGTGKTTILSVQLLGLLLEISFEDVEMPLHVETHRYSSGLMFEQIQYKIGMIVVNRVYI